MTDVRTEMRRWHDWTDPEFFALGQQREGRVWRLFARQILPKHMPRTKLTLTGWMLIVVALGIGSAAYNTASNILFMTLSLLLSSLVLSGLLSQINFRKLKWTLQPPEHLQVGEVGVAELVLKNEKRLFPSMCMAFQVGSQESGETFRLHLDHALSAGESTRLEWVFEPKTRGRYRLFLHGLESMFPFGFIRKAVGGPEEVSLLVWPARVDYTFSYAAGGRKFLTGSSRRQAGVGSDLLNLRHYEKGDPPRLIHWKASARMNKLMTRQLAQEGESGYHIHLTPEAADWMGESFEKLCSVVCALSEDLFRAGRLETVRIAGGEPIFVRSLRELHGLFDQLALLEPAAISDRRAEAHRSSQSLITFKPCGEGGVRIYVNGTPAGQA
ncbi:MAG: DUF58 domain-containing protein [Puniceicoccaceae bacterium]|nr:MAG: DUF58 domain-containing protein [Puniceicoccaceae bacterium]